MDNVIGLSIGIVLGGAIAPWAFAFIYEAIADLRKSHKSNS